MPYLQRSDFIEDFNNQLYSIIDESAISTFEKIKITLNISISAFLSNQEIERIKEQNLLWVEYLNNTLLNKRYYSKWLKHDLLDILWSINFIKDISIDEDKVFVDDNISYKNYNTFSMNNSNIISGGIVSLTSLDEIYFNFENEFELLNNSFRVFKQKNSSIWEEIQIMYEYNFSNANESVLKIKPLTGYLHEGTYKVIANNVKCIWYDESWTNFEKQFIINNQNEVINDNSSIKSYTWIQTVASNIWVINHNLNKIPTAYPLIYDSSNNVIYGEINITNLNTVTVSFSENLIGYTILTFN